MLRLMSATSTASVPSDPVPVDWGRRVSKIANATTARAVAKMIQPSRRRRRASGDTTRAGDGSDGRGMGTSG